MEFSLLFYISSPHKIFLSNKLLKLENFSLFIPFPFLLCCCNLKFFCTMFELEEIKWKKGEGNRGCIFFLWIEGRAKWRERKPRGLFSHLANHFNIEKIRKESALIFFSIDDVQFRKITFCMLRLSPMLEFCLLFILFWSSY